eukprot:NODE_16218_length_403_cov_84.675000_g15905_i0.p1 GENE.NODE_16218_length_403_cov_84.675000_g15905_i0~~NODE_16218_length_403_cov_84.675000_g15905_i0.p1  ORF type:complete len:103 (-),score=17.62 NODE_16218_length_403_cov_84.675000_g15905_i0:95-361(-)
MSIENPGDAEVCSANLEDYGVLLDQPPPNHRYLFGAPQSAKGPHQFYKWVFVKTTMDGTITWLKAFPKEVGDEICQALIAKDNTQAAQ